MKNTITKTTLSTILALLVMAMCALSQNNLTPNAPESFSTWSVPQNMGMTLNSTSNDVPGPVSPNGLSFYLSSNRTGGQGGNDIYVSQRATLTSAWGAPQNLGATVNSISNEAVTALSLDGRTMFLQSNNPSSSLGLIDLYISMRTNVNDDFGWSAPVNLGPVVNSASNEQRAEYFEDPVTGAGTLIFGSDRDGTPDINYNLYQSTRNANGTFNAPVFITELNRFFSFATVGASIRRDGLEIYIFAAPPPSQGSFDIFVSTRASLASPWNPPVPAAVFNSADEEIAPVLSHDGSTFYFASTRTGGSGGRDMYSATRVSVNRTPTADFDGDGRTDISVFRPSDGTWWVMQSGSNTVSIRQFGALGDKTVPGDYDGDGRTDLAVFRPSNASWWISNSSDSSVSVVNWGVPTDKPVAGDYDGDGKTDIAVYRNGTWYIRQSSNLQLSTQQFGLSSDIPVASVNVQ